MNFLHQGFPNLSSDR